MRCPQATTVIGMEELSSRHQHCDDLHGRLSHLVEPDIIAEVRVEVQRIVSTVRSSPAIHITAENMDDTVLNLFGDTDKVHVFSTSCRALHLYLVAVILVETLKTLDEQEVGGEPCCRQRVSRGLRRWRENGIQIGPRQLELPPNIPDLESPGQYPTS